MSLDWVPPPATQAPPLTSSPKVGEGPQLMVLSSAATMMLLFLKQVGAVTSAASSPGHHASCRLRLTSIKTKSILLKTPRGTHFAQHAWGIRASQKPSTVSPRRP